ncbi:uncharacterized protein MELLADRAFT_110999 [Melampsora larici-populina 98AG31]|uniref:Uncharacterized protein n=1 Tax=Melampsora larici-populina (strain 98AG31 / pathotype 3-4-7) TaxID=747676 RepID=F4S1Q2_MELLP|nr:uncharacterized protein MELLADRAFT_110999 [Melampsora larici-populina 98AG31]EGG01415.1 hypothetical protein MELLADRAFT_110999 [Melampsora larici-populina 98AG31]
MPSHTGTGLPVAWVNGGPEEQQPLQLVLRNAVVSRVNWDACQLTLQALHTCLQKDNCRTWMVWHTHLPNLMQLTSHYSNESPQAINILGAAWKALIMRCSGLWERILNGPSVEAQQLDEFELMEQDLLFHEEEIMRNNIDLLEEDMRDNLFLIDDEEHLDEEIRIT